MDIIARASVGAVDEITSNLLYLIIKPYPRGVASGRKHSPFGRKSLTRLLVKRRGSGDGNSELPPIS